MPKIKCLLASKKPNHIRIVFYDHSSVLAPIEVVFQHNLEKEQEIDDTLIEQIKHSTLFSKLYNRSLNLLSFRPRSQSEIKTRLQLIKESTPELVEAVIDKLKQQQLINDLEFSLWFINQRVNHRPKGPIALKYELLKKGVDSSLATQAINQIFTDSQFSLSLAKKVALKKIKTLQNYPPQKQRQKLYSFLSSRGFDYHTIKSLVDEILSQE